MKAIWTERSYGYEGVPYATYKGQTHYMGDPNDKFTLIALDTSGNQFDIRYVGKQKLPHNLNEYDIDVEVKITLLPKKAKETVVEFK